MCLGMFRWVLRVHVDKIDMGGSKLVYETIVVGKTMKTSPRTIQGPLRKEPFFCESCQRPAAVVWGNRRPVGWSTTHSWWTLVNTYGWESFYQWISLRPKPRTSSMVHCLGDDPSMGQSWMDLQFRMFTVRCKGEFENSPNVQIR